MARPLELHVWGPAFGLASIDAESLAAIAYLKQSLRPKDYLLVQNSPSGVPTHSLPALYDPAGNTWRSGFNPIISYLRTHPPPSYEDTDGHLIGLQRADAVAYSTYLTAHAAPLLALSLYVSSANWAESTRPAYSKILPFPLTWTEPLAVRAAMGHRAEHLGMSSLDADAEAERESEAEKVSAAAGWIQVPKSLKTPKRGVTDAMTPEQRARIRLDGLASEVLDVLADWETRDGPVNQEGRQTAVKCLEFAYLALMLAPDVPRPWLQQTMRTKYPSLCTFVEDFRVQHFAVSPWAEDALRTESSVLDVTARFSTGTLHSIPGFGAELKRWWLRPRSKKHDALLGLGTSLFILAASAGAFFVYNLPPYGAASYRWEKVKSGLGAFGAAGAMFVIPSAVGGGTTLEVLD